MGFTQGQHLWFDVIGAGDIKLKMLAFGIERIGVTPQQRQASFDHS
jgi:hypothetical protein